MVERILFGDVLKVLIRYFGGFMEKENVTWLEFDDTILLRI